VRAGDRSSERGQGTLEWIGLVLLVSLLLLALLTVAGSRLPAGLLARALVDRILCTASLSDSCSTVPAIVSAYGPELAAAIEENAPDLIYEPGSEEIPVDFRSCKGPTGCGHGVASGPVTESSSGEPAAAFVHVVDCRQPALAETERRGFDCSGERAGNLYLQYWLYYEDSATPPWGEAGYHADDWESYQVRVGAGETDARSSSHHGYNYGGGAGSWPSDAGLVHRDAWGRSLGHTYVSDGSHAGHVHDPDYPPTRWTPGGDLHLVPIESLDGTSRHTPFAITPPWRKDVYGDPESEGT
jgi:hypothetical protein